MTNSQQNTIDTPRKSGSVGRKKLPLQIVDFIGKYTNMPLKPHQIEGIEWMMSRNGGIIADEMGLGKTYMVCCFIAISIFQEIATKKKSTHSPILIVVPKILISQWKSEFSRMKLAISEYVNKRAISNLTITTYGNMMRSQKMREVPWSKVFFDEAHTLRNPNTRGFISASLLRGEKWLITGTPYVNHIRDVHVLLCLVKRAPFSEASVGKDTAKLQKMIETIKMEYKNNSIARKLSDYITLPKKHVRTVTIRPKKEAILHHGLLMQAQDDMECELNYNYFSNSFHIKSRIHAMVLAQMGTIMPPLLKDKYSANENEYLGDQKEVKKMDQEISVSFENYSKIQKIITDICSRRDNGRKKIIFTKYDKESDFFKKSFSAMNFDSVEIISGKTSKKMRAYILQNPPEILILNIECASCGLNLTMYTEVYFSCNTWNGMTQTQSEARVYRLGQTDEVLINKYYIEDSFDEYMNEVRERKMLNSF